MIKTAIYGASGYTGQELLRILSCHPEAEIVALTSRTLAGQTIGSVYPHLCGLPLTFTDLSPEAVAELADVIFLALPHNAAMKAAPVFLEAGKRVIDLSADFRLRDERIYNLWYGKHEAPALLSQAVYGIPELYRRQIEKARLVANPGCYPTSVILGLAPLLKGGWIDHSTIIADSKSGVSGAGREAQVGSLFCEVAEGFRAYKVGEHRHTPEIEQELSRLAGSDIRITFTPHLLPVNRGIVSTIYASLKRSVTTGELISHYQEFYRGEEFIRIYQKGAFPNISSVRGTNFCDLALSVDERVRRVTIISAIDNLVKGASGQAVQNMNIISGIPEETALKSLPVFP